ncbi:hypothetical protein HU200_031178 [Digitaria exilis]|uniref:Uncharacterized protein n=1 Tax=Digitaria exilis TaxID=1010633 RepID=A0A835BQ33_9POAL|nr:hypothetical protein HU200_031178 [Digitaria exilis]CAB3476203.1 unnamed protein product [Digitaria exilis]
MEEWRELARTVPDTLLRVAKGTIGVLGAVDSAHQQLAAIVHVVRSLRRSDGLGAINWDDARHYPEAIPTLDDARRELVRILELYSVAKQVFVLYGTCLGAEVHPLWQTWAGHGGETFGHGFRALRSLRSAASHARASRDALLMALSCPPRSPDWRDWISAALNLWRRAIWAGTKASVAARRMRDAVTVELEEAWIVLHR